jgi:hypothetical protein
VPLALVWALLTARPGVGSDLDQRA